MIGAMMNTFDSRALGPTDTYGQRFMKEGTYTYAVSPAGSGDLITEFPYAIRVKVGDNETMEQHTVMLHRDGDKLQPDQPQLEIKSGDLVTWASRQSGGQPYEVVGKESFFGSGQLFNESGYAHAFGSPGTFAWKDAHGSGLSGTVHVVDPRCRTQEDIAKWQRRLSKGQLIMITGTKAEPAEVEIVVGQTVYFAVTKAPGISISDAPMAETVPPWCPPAKRPAKKTRAAR
jgi:plastocyanin